MRCSPIHEHAPEGSTGRSADSAPDPGGAWEDRSVRSGRRLSNPPVARRHVSDKRVARPSAVLALQRTAGNRATVRYLQRRAQTDYKGLKLGRNRAGREVEIKRELGTLGGYDDRLQAIAAVRLAGVDPAAVGRDATGAGTRSSSPTTSMASRTPLARVRRSPRSTACLRPPGLPRSGRPSTT